MKHNLQFTIYNSQREEGQVMLLTVLILSALFISATAVAGLLMVYQLSQVTKIVESAQSIFAADAGIERSLFLVYRCNPSPRPIPTSWDTTGFDTGLCDPAKLRFPAAPDCSSNCLPPRFLNDATYQVTIETVPAGGHNSNADSSNVTSIKSTGRAGHSARAFEVKF